MKVKEGSFKGGRHGWVGQWGVVGGKWRQLYLNNNKKREGEKNIIHLKLKNNPSFLPFLEMLHLHNGKLCSRKKGASTLHDSMNGTGEHYAK